MITSRSGPFSLSTRASGVPADKTNLVWRAASLLWLALGHDGEPRDAQVRLVKKIPARPASAEGADAAAALVGLNRIWGGRQSRRDLIALAPALGSDVPFFLFGGTAVGTGRGDEVYPVDDVARLGIVVIKPGVGVATPDAYRWFDEDSAPGSKHQAAPARPLDVGWPTRLIAFSADRGAGRTAPAGRRRDRGRLPPGRGRDRGDDRQRVGCLRRVPVGRGLKGGPAAAAAGVAGAAEPDPDVAGIGSPGRPVINSGVCGGQDGPRQFARSPDSTVFLGRGQAVRRGTLDPVFEGSNPSAPTSS